MRIKHAASRMGLSTSGIIRFAVKQQLAAIERGVITLADCGPGLSPPSDN
jgi:hypothetical protein